MDWKPTDIEWNGGGKSGLVKFGNDNNLLVMFYNKSVPNALKSREQGRQINENKLYIKIQHPGETSTVIDRPMKEEDKQRFRDQWSKFVHNRTQVPEGTPIDLLFPNYPAVADNLRGMGVFTIEQCAELSAHAIDNIGRGAQEYVNRAKKYLDSANKGQNFHKLQAELDEEKAKNRRLEADMAKLLERFNALEGKLTDPIGNSLNPPFIKDYDPQTERINANHKTSEIAKEAKRRPSKPMPPVPADPLTDELAGLTD